MTKTNREVNTKFPTHRWTIFLMTGGNFALRFFILNLFPRSSQFLNYHLVFGTLKMYVFLLNANAQDMFWIIFDTTHWQSWCTFSDSGCLLICHSAFYSTVFSWSRNGCEARERVATWNRKSETTEVGLSSTRFWPYSKRGGNAAGDSSYRK